MKKNESVAWYTTRDLILYSLGVGCSGYDHDHLSSSSSSLTSVPQKEHDEHEQRFIYEHSNIFEAFPLFPLALAFSAIPIPKNENEDMSMKLLSSPNSDEENYFDVRSFPPPSMQGGILPSQFLRRSKDGDNDDNIDINSYPAIHISQSLSINHPFPVPRQQGLVGIYITTQITSVLPKSIGTFVTTQTEFYHLPRKTTERKILSSLLKLCTATSTVLLFGLSPSLVFPYSLKDDNDDTKTATTTRIKSKQQQNTRKIKKQSSPPSKTIAKSSSPDEIIRYDIPKSQPFLYRLSGDYNPIHVDVDAIPFFLSSMLEEEEVQQNANSDNDDAGKSKVRPILHGLCTLGYAIRAVLSYLHKKSKKEEDCKINATYVNCSFVKPLPVGDSISVLLWEQQQADDGAKRDIHDEEKKNSSRNKKVRLAFRVVNSVNGHVVVDSGIVEAMIVVDAVTTTTTVRKKELEDSSSSSGDDTIVRSKL